MSIADKLQTIANNLATESETVKQQTELLQQIRTALGGKTVPGDPGDSGSYDEGYADGQQNVLDIVNYELAGRDLETAETADDVSSALDNAFIEVSDVAYGYGKQAEYDAFWDAYQQNGERTDYSMLFSGAGWTAETFKPKYLIRPGGAGNHYMMFARTGVEVLDETILDTSQCTAFSMSFYNSSRLKSITIDIKSLKAFADVFNFGGALETVALKNVPETCNFTGGFSGCNKLTNFTVTGTIGGTAFNLSSCSMLTDASVQCIIDHLKDRTGTTAATLTFHATVGGKLTQAQKDAISAKNWTLVY